MSYIIVAARPIKTYWFVCVCFCYCEILLAQDKSQTDPFEEKIIERKTVCDIRRQARWHWKPSRANNRLKVRGLPMGKLNYVQTARWPQNNGNSKLVWHWKSQMKFVWINEQYVFLQPKTMSSFSCSLNSFPFSNSVK